MGLDKVFMEKGMPDVQRKYLKSNIMPSRVLKLLVAKYGPFEWQPRYEPIWELIYTILSQHTSDVNSERAFNKLFSKFSSPSNIASAEVSEIEKTIRSAGLFRVKARRIKEVLNCILKEIGSFDLSFLSEMPMEDAKKWLKNLDGIGPKTAAIILCFSFGMPAMPVDTHIFRVAKRLGFIGSKVTAEQAHDILESMISPEDIYSFHLCLINHGREICKAVVPKCQKCVLESDCPKLFTS